jgi:hypothetical protein
MNKPDHICESSETIFWAKNIKLSGWKKFGTGIRERKNSQHCSGGRFSLQILEQELLEKRVEKTQNNKNCHLYFLFCFYM